jgi:ribosomal protein S18 acetylase RimI-like enzyme
MRMEIRAATAADYDAYVALLPELGVDDPTPSRERFGNELVARMTIACEGDEVVGYVLADVMATTGYIRNIVTAPGRRGRGVGRAMMDDMRTRFRVAGATTWCLNVKPDNAAAIALYERCGMRRAFRSCSIRVGRELALPEPPDDVVLAPVASAEDEELERAFGLLRGQLETSRVRLSRRVLQLRHGDTAVGVAVFSDSFPGAFPFRTRDPALAAAFVVRLRELCPAGALFLQVGVEDDEPLRAAIVALGGVVRLEIEHMRGAI